ncbi:MAG: 16S rRNA (uracil(1498)-N(3))-methyltransferase [Chloroflexi bacterium]|nr:16S rRNA (uracil(1498)-N(3))-methyltransferase [Chloroflexota bacterium]
MHRFFLPPDAIREGVVWFSDDQARQIRRVLRLKSGDEVWVLDGQGACYRVALEHLGKRETRGRVLERLTAEGEPRGDVILCQAMAKGERFEWVLQKGVELGVTHFQPMITRRTVRRSVSETAFQRWRRIIREAAEQSGRGKLPHLAEPVSFKEAVLARRGLALLPSVAASRPLSACLSNATWPVTIFVGPEGGFAPEEIAFARAQGVEPVGLGPRILRTETAAVVILALVMNALGELDRPTPRA